MCPLHFIELGLVCRKLDMRSGALQTLELKGVPPPRRDPDTEPLEASGTTADGPPMPRGAMLIMPDAAITSTSAQVCTEPCQLAGCNKPC